MNGIESNSSVNISKFSHYMFLRLLSLEIFACFLGFLVGTCSSILQIILYMGTQSSSDLLIHLYKSLFFLSINVISTSLSSSSMPTISPTYHFFHRMLQHILLFGSYWLFFQWWKHLYSHVHYLVVVKFI